MAKLPLNQIKPLVCKRLDGRVRAYVAMLREGKKAPEILVIKQRNKRHRYRIFDGAHRARAAKLVGRTTIEARIIVTE